MLCMLVVSSLQVPFVANSHCHIPGEVVGCHVSLLHKARATSTDPCTLLGLCQHNVILALSISHLKTPSIVLVRSKLTMGNILEQADAYLASLLYDWSFTTTLIALALAAFIAYPIFSPSEPDTHPLLLARQSAINPVRNKNESAIYRSPEVPGDTPLKSGLGVKDASAPRWAMGKDGDVRDVWREVMKGGKEDDVPKGRILTVLGREEIVEHEVDKITGEIAVIGKHLKDAGVQRVAIYLPNCVEYLMAVFGMCIMCRLENRNSRDLHE
jgi:hypothetical protein